MLDLIPESRLFRIGWSLLRLHFLDIDPEIPADNRDMLNQSFDHALSVQGEGLACVRRLLGWR